jgi:hypothetical protein
MKTRLDFTGNPNGPSLYHLLEVLGNPANKFIRPERTPDSIVPSGRFIFRTTNPARRAGLISVVAPRHKLNSCHKNPCFIRVQSVAKKSFARFASLPPSPRLGATSARLIANYFGSFAARTSIFSMTGGWDKSSGALANRN